MGFFSPRRKYKSIALPTAFYLDGRKKTVFHSCDLSDQKGRWKRLVKDAKCTLLK